MAGELSVIENFDKVVSPETENIQNLLSLMASFSRPVLNLTDSEEEKKRKPVFYDELLFEPEALQISTFMEDYFNIKESSKRVFVSSAFTQEVDTNKTRLYKGRIEVFAFGNGITFYLSSYPDYLCSNYHISKMGIGVVEEPIPTEENFKYFDLFNCIYVILSNRYLKKQAESV